MLSVWLAYDPRGPFDSRHITLVLAIRVGSRFEVVTPSDLSRQSNRRMRPDLLARISVPPNAP